MFVLLLFCALWIPGNSFNDRKGFHTNTKLSMQENDNVWKSHQNIHAKKWIFLKENSQGTMKSLLMLKKKEQRKSPVRRGIVKQVEEITMLGRRRILQVVERNEEQKEENCQTLGLKWKYCKTDKGWQPLFSMFPVLTINTEKNLQTTTVSKPSTEVSNNIPLPHIMTNAAYDISQFG